MKTCTKCLMPKPLDEFIKDNRLKTGRGSRCTLCDRAIKTQPRRDALARKAAALEEQVASFRPVSLAIAAELVYDRSLREDCTQEALIRVWEILKRQPDASRPYVHKAIKRRIMDISMRQTFTGHTGQRGTLTDPLRRPHSSIDAMLDLGWEPTE